MEALYQLSYSPVRKRHFTSCRSEGEHGVHRTLGLNLKTPTDSLVAARDRVRA